MNPAQLAAAGPRAAGHQTDYAELMEDILAGARMHYRLDPTHDDPDLSLLEGDDRYARGLAKLAALGDLEATAGLADIISLVAQANAAGDLELADAVWWAGAVAIGWGTSDALEAAKSRARAGARDAAPALLAAAAARRAHEGRGSGARSEL
jgi:hypothetical protein